MTFVLRHRLRRLLDTWNQEHGDWCCQRGCTYPGARHADTAAITAWLATLGNPHQHYDDLPTVPCPGECTCHVGPFIAGLQAALRGGRP